MTFKEDIDASLCKLENYLEDKYPGIGISVAIIQDGHRYSRGNCATYEMAGLIGHMLLDCYRAIENQKRGF